METEKKNSSGMLVGILIGIIIMLLVGACLFATGTISFKATTISDNGQTSENNQTDNIEKTKEMTKEEAKDISVGVMDKYFTEIFYYHQSLYCGEDAYKFNEVSYYQAENGETYVESKQYKTKTEIKEYFKTYLSDEYIKKIVDDKNYIEKDDKLYCISRRASGLSYIKEKSMYEISEISENIIIGKGTIAYSSVDSELMLSCKYTIIKENGNWVLDKYEEEL